MRILVILNDLDVGGAQNYTISLMNEFIKLGHKVELRVLSNNLLLKHRLYKQIKVKVWARKKKLDFKIISKIKNEIKNSQYDGVISSYIIYQKLATLFLKNNPVTIYPIHSSIQKYRKAVIFNYLIFKTKRKYEIFLTSIDNQTRYLIDKYNLKNDFFEQIYNGVDTDKFTLPPVDFNREEFLKSKGINPTNRIILMVAGFRNEKRHIDAIDAFKLLSQTAKDTSIVFVGDNRKEECNKLINYAGKLGSENIHFFTADIAGDVRNYYWISDLFTLTSDKVETFPISALEAMSSGLPCVLTNIGGSKDFIIDGVNGYLSKANDVININKKWKEALNCIQFKNKNQLREIVVKNYSLNKAVNDYLNLLDVKLKDR